MVTWSFLHKHKIINMASTWVTATVYFDTGNTCFCNHFTRAGGVGDYPEALQKSVNLYFLWKPQFCSIHILKQVSIHGILFFSIENYLWRRLFCNIWQWKSSSWMHGIIYLLHIPVSGTDWYSIWQFSK